MKSFTFDDSWDAIKSQLKKRYSQLTDEDLTFTEGKGDAMLARIRETLGLSAKDLRTVLDELHERSEGLIGKTKAKVGEWTEDLREKASEVADDLKEKASVVVKEAKAQASEVYGQARERALVLRDDGMQYVRKNPRESLIVALCAGFVAGLIIRH